MNKSEQGKANRKNGAAFERAVRKDLEERGWHVCKYMNNVEDGKVISAKHKFNPFMHVMSIGTGFPDFLLYANPRGSEIVGVECKINGRLDKTEKEKCTWLLQNQVFNKILVASKENKKIKYVDVSELL